MTFLLKGPHCEIPKGQLFLRQSVQLLRSLFNDEVNPLQKRFGGCVIDRTLDQLHGNILACQRAEID